MLRIAVQKSGRLQEDSLLILKECGLKVDASNGKLKSIVPNFPLEMLFLRNSDIPQYVEDGVVDIAIIGENLLIEEESKLEVLLSLSFSKCRVSLAVPKNSDIQSVKDFQGKKIATSYPATVQNYLRKNGVTAEIHTISGSVEVAPTIGLADGICDIVSSGNTLFMNGLRELEVILQSEAVLVKNSKLSAEKQEILDKLIFRMKAVLSSRNSKYILLNAPNDAIAKISSILPGMKSPTVLPLAEPGWSSLHSVISEDQFWEKIDALKSAGAEGILIVPIEKMVL
ncbi:MAG: ATP phosphoribosyltransferase [Crocinitomicaceae bacterium]|nr:ATP phosphoribosyltransferase [Crocinitomicaceae bacterium]